jgi:hypothetical protein
MQLTQAKLAKLWGVSRVAVHHLVKKGMPLSSISDAEDWRDANTRNQRGGRASDKSHPLPDSPEATEKKAARIRQAATVDEAERYLSEVEELRNFAKENAETLWQQGLADDSRKWLTVHQAIAKQYRSSQNHDHHASCPIHLHRFPRPPPWPYRLHAWSASRKGQPIRPRPRPRATRKMAG